jgi:two-component system response regulator YesN
MSQLFLLFANLIVPLISGLFLLFYFAYFVFAHPAKLLSFKLFVVFLIAFSAFLFGRPLQLILGPHPLPLIIVNVRVFVLCSVLSPILILTAWNFNRRITLRQGIIVFAACLPLGIVYAVFNTLGTSGSFVLFDVAGIAAHENLTPSMQPPFFAREVTIAVQTVTGIILLAFSLVRFAQERKDSRKKSLFSDKIILINAGIFIFALSFILGSIARQWWVYYATSVATALVIGGSVLIDIKELHSYYEKLVPYIKEEIMTNVSFSEVSVAKLTEMFDCLGKRVDLNTFILIRAKKDGYAAIDDDSAAMGGVVQEISRWLEVSMSEKDYLIIPVEDEAIGIIARLDIDRKTNRQGYILGALDELREKILATCGRELAIGIGRTYESPAGLRASWHEATLALEYAEQLKDCGIVHVENIRDEDRRTITYPIQEKERLVLAIRSGDADTTMDALGAFLPHFRRYAREQPAILKFRLNELVCSFVDSAILGGGDEKTLAELMAKYIDEIPRISDDSLAERWLEAVIREIAGNVGTVYEKRSRTLIENAKKYIETNCRSQIGYRDVAREIFISPSYFLNLFKKETGTTFVDYLTSIRIEKAKQMLVSTNMTITEIAYDLGFNNANYFSSIFRKTTGVSATEYRKPHAVIEG